MNIDQKSTYLISVLKLYKKHKYLFIFIYNKMLILFFVMTLISTLFDLPKTKTGMKAPDGMGIVVETADIQNCEMNKNVFT